MRFLKQIDRETPEDVDLHLIADNYCTHKHEKVVSWLQKHPRFHMHFIPTSSSWMNMVERFFADLTQDCVRAGSFTSVAELVDAIMTYLACRNENPKPYKGKADGAKTLAGFFLPVRVLSRYFRRVLLAALEDAFESGQLHFAGRLQPLSDPRRFAEHLRPARKTEWVVYAKRPFAGPEQVLDYLGRYTHRVAISNQRLCSLDDGSVRFGYTDYRSNGASRRKTMTLAATEFIRRMLLHVLSPGFHRIRYYGFLANRARQRKLAECRRLLDTPPPSPAEQTGRKEADYRDRFEALTGRSLRQCPPLPRRRHATDRLPRRRLGVSGHCGFVVTAASSSASRASAAPGVAGAVDLRLRSSRRAARPPSRPSPPTAGGRQPTRTTPPDRRLRRLPAKQRP